MGLANASDILRHSYLSSAVGFALWTESLEGVDSPAGLCDIMPRDNTWYLVEAQKASVTLTNDMRPLPALPASDPSLHGCLSWPES